MESFLLAGPGSVICGGIVGRGPMSTGSLDIAGWQLVAILAFI